MLAQLYIENIAVIERAEIALDSGLNVLTGETGAGKSIIIDALNAVLGERVSRDMIRAGCDGAEVTAVFAGVGAGVAARLEALGFAPDEEGQLLLFRRLTADGKNVCRIGGRPATVALLREVGGLLVNIHGQHENQALLSPATHVEYLDKLGGLLDARAQYAAAYRRYREVERLLREADVDESAKERQMDLLRYQIDEIETAALREGEEDALTERRGVLRNAEKIGASLLGAEAALRGDEGAEGSGGALPGLRDAVTALREAGRFLPAAGELLERTESALYELEACADDAGRLLRSLEVDERERDMVEERLDLIHRLCKKYGAGTEGVLRYLEQARQELADIELADERVARLAAELEEAGAGASAQASALTAARRQAAAGFCDAVMEQLAFLDMPGVRVEVAMTPCGLRESGAEEVEFLIAANPGEPARPVAKIASGGELSRMMLALQTVLADTDDIDTLVFDEVDAGISGRAAAKVGIKLRQTATGLSGTRRRQVLCVTHLAQIAAAAHAHLLTRKEVRQERTYTEVEALEEAGRERELARIISGGVTEAGVLAAREMRQGMGGQA